MKKNMPKGTFDLYLEEKKKEKFKERDRKWKKRHQFDHAPAIKLREPNGEIKEFIRCLE